MDRYEARSILRNHLDRFRSRKRAELFELIAEPENFSVDGAAGLDYQLEFLAVWDDRTDGDLRVMGSIDDGGISAWLPMTEAFILAPDGSFVGE